MPVANMTSWVVGALRPTPTITWYQADDTIQDLTDVSAITGVMTDVNSGTAKAIAGTLAVSDATAGEFTWTLVAGDVDTAGDWQVQFSAAYSSGQTPARSYSTTWRIESALVVA